MKVRIKTKIKDFEEQNIMRKFITLGIFTLALIIMFTGCSKADSQAQQSAETTYAFSEEDEYRLSLAQKAESYAEVFDILQANDSEEFQIALANIDNHIVQEALLNYKNLSTTALIAICENFKSPNLQNSYTKSYFENAICNANLTPEQELQIAKTNKYPMQMGILCRQNLSGDALIYLIESNNTLNWVINLNHFQTKEIVYNQVINVNLNLEQKEKLKELDIYNVNKALKEREKREFQQQLINNNQEEKRDDKN